MRLAAHETELIDRLDERLRRTSSAAAPFPHARIESLFEDEIAASILAWLEHEARWIYDARGFYLRQCCKDLHAQLRDTPAAFAASLDVVGVLRRHLERLFAVDLNQQRFTLHGQRLLPGYRIGAHNDQPLNGTDTHRVVVSFNRAYSDSNGGHLILFRPDDIDDSAVLMRPTHNSAVALELSKDSWHAVDEVVAGERYSIVYAFWRSNAAARIATDPSLTLVSAADSTETRASESQTRHRVLQILRAIDADAHVHDGMTLVDASVDDYRRLERWTSDEDACAAGLCGTALRRLHATPARNANLADQFRNVIGERASLLLNLKRRLQRDALLDAFRTGEVSEADARVVLHESDRRALAVLFWTDLFGAGTSAPTELLPLEAYLDVTWPLLSECARNEIAGRIRGRHEM